MQHVDVSYPPVRMLTRVDVAGIFCKSVYTIDRWRGKGLLPAVMLPTEAVLHRPEDVRNFIEKYAAVLAVVSAEGGGIR
jgi:hypothetical protein